MGASLLLRPEFSAAQNQPLIQKKIPSSGEAIPVIGIGTARRYRRSKATERKCRCAKLSGNFTISAGR